MIFGEDESQGLGRQPNPQQQPTQIRIDMTGMETVYANFFALGGSAEELVVYLGANSPLPNSPQPAAKISHRVMMIPANAKRLLIALQQAIKAHEDRFGPIELPRTGQGG